MVELYPSGLEYPIPRAEEDKVPLLRGWNFVLAVAIMVGIVFDIFRRVK